MSSLENIDRPTLVIVTGPTAVGKTDFVIALAKKYGTSILSADSRQFYKEMKIGTAAPSAEELAAVPHYFVGHLSIADYYNVYKFEQDVLALLPSLFAKNDLVLMTGGSGLYIDAVCHGIDELPDPDMKIRDYVNGLFRDFGLSEIRSQLRTLDPQFYETNDMANSKRMIRALEVCLQTGRPYSEQLARTRRQRDFDIRKFCLTRPREELFARINARTDQMMEKGWLEEARTLYPHRALNALNTVGYKELFAYFDGECPLEKAVADIKTHTRHYAKRQMTWFKRDADMQEITTDAIL